MRTFYLRDKNNFPVACVASNLVTRVRPGKPIEKRIRFAVSTYNPHDRFDKKEATRVAVDRLTGKEPGVVYSFAVQPKLVKAIITGIIAQDDYGLVPHRTREAARLYIKNLLDR